MRKLYLYYRLHEKTYLPGVHCHQEVLYSPNAVRKIKRNLLSLIKKMRWSWGNVGFVSAWVEIDGSDTPIDFDKLFSDPNMKNADIQKWFDRNYPEASSDLKAGGAS